MTTVSFNLIDEPWLPVRRHDGSVGVLSLPELFEQAPECVSLVGELPTQDFALLRLLLAILLRAHQDANGPADWGKLFRADRFDRARIAAYLEAHRERFDLLHPAAPFYQVAALATSKGGMTELARVIADVPPKHQYFTTRAGGALERMPFAEAARWVVHCQAFDPSGIKSGAADDPRVRGGKGYPIGKGWCANLGCVAVEGGSLFQTLMLNLRLVRRRDRDQPAWERAPLTGASAGRFPDGPADLMTWQSRRIRLGHDGGQVTSVLIANGDALPARNTMAVEDMTSWRYSEPQTKAHGQGDSVFMPREHSPRRQVWRGLASLLAESPEPPTSPTRPPVGGWLTWLSRLRDGEELPQDLPIRVRTTAMFYGSNDSVVDDVVTDALALSAATLGSAALRSLAVDAVHDADEGARLVARLAGELAEAAGLSGEGVKTSQAAGRERAYGVLDRPFRAWLASLDAGVDPAGPRLEWQRDLCRRLLSVAGELSGQAGPLAWVGRAVSRGPDRRIHLDAGVAELGFRRQLRGAFPGMDLATTPTTREASA